MLSDKVEALTPGSVEDALLRVNKMHTASNIEFVAAVVLDRGGNFTAFQGGDCAVLEVVGMLDVLKTRITVDAMDIEGGEP